MTSMKHRQPPLTSLTMAKNPIEAQDSWESFLQQSKSDFLAADATAADTPLSLRHDEEDRRRHRQLKKHHKKQQSVMDMVTLEQAREESYLKDLRESNEENVLRASSKHQKRMKQLLANPSDIDPTTVHGFMIDAGSTGSRIHLYEWSPRVLSSRKDVEDAVAGRKLSFPTSSSRWSDRLRPGLGTFASLTDDDELKKAISDYLSPLLEFAKMILREKGAQFGSFPIFLRATAGMRTLDRVDRHRVLNTVKTLFNDKSFCPFYFEDEFARVLSGEEEAVFGWAGTNFVQGNLLKESQGVGTVLNPRLTYGALDMGGASTQISFYDPDEDIMSGLFKLQIGQGKHWNIYAHSFLYFGMNEARNRFQAKLLDGANATSRLLQGVYNPCLPGGSRQEVRLDIHYDKMGRETWGSFDNSYYQGVLKNEGPHGDFEACMKYAKDLLHLEDNQWCNFAHRGDCSFNGVAMPEKPRQSEHFGEFLAISNYFHVWDFLGLPTRASLHDLHNRTAHVCSMGSDELHHFNKNNAKVSKEDVNDYCFRSTYVFNVLRYGYGFGLDEHITATDVLKGQKIGWALGAMLYEINTSPWEYKEHQPKGQNNLITFGKGGVVSHLESIFFSAMVIGIAVAIVGIFIMRSRRKSRELYSQLK